MKIKLLSYLLIILLALSVFTLNGCDIIFPSTDEEDSDISSGDFDEEDDDEDDQSDSSDTNGPTVGDGCNHEFGDWYNYTEMTCTKSGEDRRDCKKCDYYESKTLRNPGHTVVIDEAVEPTCTTTGLTEGKHCSVCKEVLKEQEVLPTKHNEVIDAGVEATCTTTGLTEGKHCSSCNEVLVEQEIIPEKHNFVDRVCTLCGAEDLSPTPDQYFTFLELDDGTYSVSIKDKNNVPSVVIVPDTYNGKAVTEVKSFEGCKNLTKIVIPDSVTMIYGSAFSGCSNLTSMVLPFIGQRLEKYENTYQYPFGFIFGTNEYDGGVKTQQFYYLKGINDRIYKYYYIPEKLTDVTIIGGSIPHGAFMNCSNLVNVNMPSTATYVGNYAFSHCTSIINVIIPDGVVEIGYQAFSGCGVNIYIPEKLSKVGDYAFNTKSKIYVTNIEGWLKIEFGFNAHPNYYGTLHFLDANGEEITDVVIPDAIVTHIPSNAFKNAVNVTSITIPKSVISIDQYICQLCPNLTKIIFEDADNWYISSQNGTNVSKMPSTDISDHAMAATYLKETYSSYLWFK